MFQVVFCFASVALGQTSLRLSAPAASTLSEPLPEVLILLKKRQAFRKQPDWTGADDLCQQIADLGWQVLDTPEGPQLEPISEPCLPVFEKGS